jgi:hypothetical protein
VKAVVACTDAFKWLKANGHDLAGMTGQDRRALSAIAHCWELFSAGDDDARAGAALAVRALLPAMQNKYIPLAKELIAYAMDWDDRERYWPRVIS